MTHDSQPLSVNALAQQCRDRAAQPPIRRHRTTIARTAKRLAVQAEASSGGVYWSADKLASWHPDDFYALGERLEGTGVSAMAIHGELCFGCEP